MRKWILDQAGLAAFGLICAVSLCAADGTQVRRATLGNRADAGGGAAPSMSRPVAGYVAQASPPELRAILGVPGAAVLSDPLPLPALATRVRIASGQRYALLERDHEEPAVLFLVGSKAGQLAGIAGALPVADFAAFSPSGYSAVLYSTVSGQLQVITGLPDSPQIGQGNYANVAPVFPKAMAISDDGGSVLLSSDSEVYLLSGGGSARVVANISDGAALAFLPNSATAAIGDRGTGLVSLLNGQAQTRLLTGNLDGIGDISATGDGLSLYITRPTGPGIWLVGVLSGEARMVDVGSIPLTIDRLGSADNFLISWEPGRPAWIFSRQGDDARTVFVPAARLIPEETMSGQKNRD